MVAGEGEILEDLIMETVAKKRRLRDQKSSTKFWSEATVSERLEAVETINRLKEPEYAEQAFPRIHRITRKARG